MRFVAASVFTVMVLGSISVEDCRNRAWDMRVSGFMREAYWASEETGAGLLDNYLDELAGGGVGTEEWPDTPPHITYRRD